MDPATRSRPAPESVAAPTARHSARGSDDSSITSRDLKQIVQFDTARLAADGRLPSADMSHQTEDEIFHVLEGQLRVRAGDTEVRIGAGETILGPKGVPHTYRVESHEGARWLLITRRGDFERLKRLNTGGLED